MVGLSGKNRLRHALFLTTIAQIFLFYIVYSWEKTLLDTRSKLQKISHFVVKFQNPSKFSLCAGSLLEMSALAQAQCTELTSLFYQSPPVCLQCIIKFARHNCLKSLFTCVKVCKISFCPMLWWHRTSVPRLRSTLCPSPCKTLWLCFECPVSLPFSPSPLPVLQMDSWHFHLSHQKVPGLEGSRIYFALIKWVLLISEFSCISLSGYWKFRTLNLWKKLSLWTKRWNQGQQPFGGSVPLYNLCSSSPHVERRWRREQKSK